MLGLVLLPNRSLRKHAHIWLTLIRAYSRTRRIAQDIAAAPESKKILIDAFAGAGGNTIAFALSGRWKQIFAIEKDPNVLACAKHNAEVYGVANKIWFVEGDCFNILQNRLKGQAKNAVIFASPPWGGQ